MTVKGATSVQKSFNKITPMLLLVSTVFVCCTCPVSLFKMSKYFHVWTDTEKEVFQLIASTDIRPRVFSCCNSDFFVGVFLFNRVFPKLCKLGNIGNKGLQRGKVNEFSKKKNLPVGIESRDHLDLCSNALIIELRLRHLVVSLNL